MKVVIHTVGRRGLYWQFFFFFLVGETMERGWEEVREDGREEVREGGRK